MQVFRAGDAPERQGRTCTGETMLTSLLPRQQPDGVALSVVRFKDGSRTNWHVHPGEQVLYIVEGEGRAGNEDGEFRVRAGDVIYAPPGERHWHGAVEGGSMTHISLTTHGDPEWFEPPD